MNNGKSIKLNKVYQSNNSEVLFRIVPQGTVFVLEGAEVSDVQWHCIAKFISPNQAGISMMELVQAN